VCGGCHTDAHHPTFDEWRQSGHGIVTEDMNSASRISNCGRCHSGSVRLSMLNHEPLPAGDANLGIECVVCHDPHRQTGNPAQLRNPLVSTNDYFLATGDVFTNKYDANINVCGQCHNHRGATYDSNARAPHHSPQYNMMLGTVGELADGQPPNRPGPHALRVQNQCVGCHMQSTPFQGEEHAAVTGHHFKVETYDSCAQCHPFPEVLAVFAMTSVSNQIQQVKAALDLWGTTKAPEALRTKYGARAWEYTSPGSLSSGGSGPTAAEQSQIPENIRKARFNVYIVYHDGSFGIHNGRYAITLLQTAQSWIQQELNR
jgi:formate-dependent nitrite reductase cytochrome c552 subunit